MPQTITPKGKYVSLARGSVVHAVKGNKTRCGRPLTRPDQPNRNDAIGWYDTYPEHNTRFCPKCLAADPEVVQNQLTEHPPVQSAAYYNLWAGNRFDSQGQRNILLHFIHQKGLSDECNEFIEKFFPRDND